MSMVDILTIVEIIYKRCIGDGIVMVMDASLQGKWDDIVNIMAIMIK